MSSANQKSAINLFSKTYGGGWVPHASHSPIATLNREWLVEQLQATAKDLGVVAKIDTAFFAAHTYAYGSPFTVELGADLISWLFLFDDAYGEAKIIEDPAELEFFFRDMLAYLATEREGFHFTPFHSAMLQLIKRAELEAHPDFRTRFLLSLKSYFDGCLAEYRYRSTISVPSLREYRRIREGSIGAYPVFDLIELGVSKQGYSSDIWQQPFMIEARRFAAYLCSWVNDLFSFSKETLEKDPLNLISVMAKEENLNAGEAFSRACDVHAQDGQIFDRIVHEALLVYESNPFVRRYLIGLKYWTSGNFYWTLTARRYLDADDALAKLAPAATLSSLPETEHERGTS